jgi:hypothetical protein
MFLIGEGLLYLGSPPAFISCQFPESKDMDRPKNIRIDFSVFFNNHNKAQPHPAT